MTHRDSEPNESGQTVPSMAQRSCIADRTQTDLAQKNSSIDRTIDEILSSVADRGQINARADVNELRRTARLILVNILSMDNLRG